MTGLALEVDIRIDLGVTELAVALESEARAIAIRGPSGSGKSSLLRVLAGVDRRATGSIVALGETWQDSDKDDFVDTAQRGVGWLPQDGLLFPHLTVRENLGYAGAAPEAVLEMGRQLEIERLMERRPRHLSGGEAQRVALGRALLRDPRLLLLDEPFAALDTALEERVCRALEARCADRAIPLILVTHNARIAERLCSEHFQVTEGRLSPISP